MLSIHRLREGFKAERVACINRIRGLLAEFGLVFAQQPLVLRQALADVIEDACNDLGGLARIAIERAWMQWQELDTHLAWCDARIAAHLKASEPVQRAEKLLGIGPVTASAVVATVRCLARVSAAPALQRRQGQSGRHYQARRYLLAHFVDSRR
jgi:transposase